MESLDSFAVHSNSNGGNDCKKMTKNFTMSSQGFNDLNSKVHPPSKKIVKSQQVMGLGVPSFKSLCLKV
jgi:hypothetical protein